MGAGHEQKGRSIASLVRALGSAPPGTVRASRLAARKVDLPLGFAGFVAMGDQLLGLCTDGVGSKLLLARQTGLLEGVGIDCVAMNVNDLICHGARPIAFVDYVALERSDEKLTAAIGRGLAEGARQAGIPIVGGETASLPEIITDFDLAGMALGVVRRRDLIDGRAIRPDDLVVGVPSSDFHSNGFTLLRRVLADCNLPLHRPPPWRPKGRRSVAAEVLAPTSIYVGAVLDLLRQVRVRGMAHITGGGVRNLLRLHPRLGFDLHSPLPVPEAMQWFSQNGPVRWRECYQTFNMGMGLAIVIPTTAQERTLRILRSWGHAAQVVGTVTRSHAVTVDGVRGRWEVY